MGLRAIIAVESWSSLGQEKKICALYDRLGVVFFAARCADAEPGGSTGFLFSSAETGEQLTLGRPRGYDIGEDKWNF